MIIVAIAPAAAPWHSRVSDSPFKIEGTSMGCPFPPCCGKEMIPPLEQLSLPQLSVFSPNRAKRHFLDRRNIPRMNPETGVDGSNFLDWPET
jgi:hypothetical protein